jgi:hypothetical protein
MLEVKIHLYERDMSYLSIVCGINTTNFIQVLFLE